MNPSTKNMQKNFSTLSLAALAVWMASILGAPVHAQSFELPAMKVVQAPLVSPSSAITYYGSGTTHSYSLPSVQANATAGTRPAEIKELAKGLGATQVPSSLTQDQYAQRVFEYVRQNVDTTFMYGLQRGALGALINQSGTSFDQAQLMVELLREGGITGANYEVGTITLSAAQFTAWTGISNAAAACRLLADGGIPGTVNGSSDSACGMTGAVSSITLRHVWVTALSKKYDAAYKTYTTKTGIDLAAAMGCGTASAPTCKADVQTALTSGAQSGLSNGVDYYQNLNATAFNNKVKSFATTLQATLKQSYSNALIEDIIGGAAIDFTTLPTPAATLPYSSVTSTATWTEIPDQYRIKLRVNFDNLTMNTTNVAVPHNEFYVDELYGKRLYLMGSIDPNNFAIRKTMLFVDHELVAQSTRNDASVDNATLSLTVNHPYVANSGGYLDEQTILPTGAHVVYGAYSWFYPTTILHEWGAVGTGRLSYAQAKESRDGYIRNFTNPYGVQYDHDCTHTFRPPSMVIGTRSTAGGIPFGEVFACLQVHQVSHLANWSVQNSRMQEVVGQINASEVLLQHALGFMTSGADNNGTVSIASSLSVISKTNTATDRQAAAWSLAGVSAHLESHVFQQGQSSWEAASPVSLLVRSNEKGHSLFLATPSNLNTALAQTQNYPDSVKQRMTTYGTQGASLILSSNWYPGIFFSTPPFPVGIDSNGYIAFQPNGTFIAHLTGVLGLKGGLGTASPDPARDVRESVQQMDGSVKTRKYYGVDVSQGQLTLSPPADLVSGTGGFPKSLEFKRLYSSATDPVPHSASTVSTLPGDPPNGQPPGSPAPEYFAGDTQQWLPGGWDFSLHIRATLGADVLQSMGADSALDASATIAAFYVLREVNRTLITTPQQAFLPQLTTTFGTYWWGTMLIDSAVVVRRPPSSDTFMRLPDGTFNPPPNSADVLVQSNTRTGPAHDIEKTWRDLTYNYSGVTLALTDRNGSTVNFAWQGVEKSGYFGTRQSRLFDAVSWSFPDGMRVDYEYTDFRMCDQGSLLSPKPKKLTAIRNNLGRRLEFMGFDTAANGNGGPFCSIHPYVVKDETNRAVTVTLENTPAGLPSVVVTTTDAASAVVSTTRYDYLTTTNDPTAARVGMLMGSWFTPTDVYPSSPLAKVQYDKLLRVASLDSAANNAAGTRPRTDYLIGGLGFGELLHRGESIDPLGAHNTTYFDRFGKDVQQIDALNRTTWKIYDSRRRLKSVILPEGNSTEYTYDLRSNVLTEKQLPKPGSTWAATTITSTYPEGTSVYPCVNPATCNQPKTKTDKKGRVIDYDYYTNGQIKQMKAPTVGSERAESDYCYTNYTTSTGPLSLLSGTVNLVGGGKPNRVSTFAYNSANKYVLQSATVDPTASLTTACAATTKSGAKNVSSTFTFDAVGNASTIDGPRSDVSDVSTYAFDAMRRLKQVDGPPGTGAKTVYTYFDDGTLRYVDKYEGAIVRREERTYWPSGDLKSVQDPEGNLTQTNYDLGGRANLTTDPDGRRVGTAYDLAGQARCIWKGWASTTAPALWTTLNPATCNWNPADYVAAGNNGPYRYVAYTYTLNGKQATIQDSNNNQTDLVYDKHDRLRYTLFPSPSTGSRCTAATAETVTALTCPTGATYEELRYSTSGAPATSSSGLCSGNDQVCAKRTRANQVITSTYDAMNRLSTKVAPSLPTVTTTYNLLSEPLSVTSPSQTTPAIPAHNVTYDYSDVGQKLFEKNTLNGTVRQVSYGYDSAGNRTSTTWPDTYLVSYEYDALNRMSKVWEGAPTTGVKLADYSYDTLSRRKELQYANQASNKISYQYELDSNLDILTNVLNTVTVTLDYGRNHSGQITTIDGSDRFYLPSKALLTTTAYVPNKLNQYGTVGGQIQTYDSNGNMLTWFPVGGKHTYTYDAENRLRTAAVNGSATASITYDYDSLGRRLSKTVSGTSTYYLLDGDEEIAEYSSGGAVLRRYITGPAVDSRIARVEGASLSNPTKYYYHVNHQGSVIDMTDSIGTITEKMAYDEYGNLTSDPPASSTGEQYRYTGRRFDTETGLYYYRARYYSPAQGRFLQADPIGYRDDFNLYGYVGSDPLNATDPSGECAFICTAIIGAGLEFVVQAVEITYGTRSGYDLKAIGVAAASSAVGFGLSRQINNISRIANLGKTGVEVVKAGLDVANDAAISAASKYAKGEEVTLSGVVTDTLVSQAMGNTAGHLAGKQATSSAANKLADRAANRAERIAANSSRASRQDAAEHARDVQRDIVSRASASADTAAGNVGSAVMEIKEAVNSNCSQQLHTNIPCN